MYIDSHCHLDLLDNPLDIVHSYNNYRSLCVLVTLLPSHYQAALPHIKNFDFIKASVGLHPLRIEEGQKEINSFQYFSNYCNFIGEIGLDFSSEGKSSKRMQLETFRSLLSCIRPGRFVSVHSRGAYEEAAQLLDDFSITPVCFHYFTGSIELALTLAKKRHFFSVNKQMLFSRHRDLLHAIPKEQILVETDAPYLTKNPLSTLKEIYKELSIIWKCELYRVSHIIASNFNNCRTGS